jgi:hypothetical protein
MGNGKMRVLDSKLVVITNGKMTLKPEKVA